MLTRINKALANKGLCSRREADEWIANGWVFKNGVCVTEFGSRVDLDLDVLTVEKPNQVKRYYLLHKPRGYLSTVVENEGLSLLRLLPEPMGLFPVGRLDKDSEGIIIVTNDRSLPAKIIGDGAELEKEYDVVLDSPIDQDLIDKIEEGLVLDGVKLKTCEIKLIEPSRCLVILREGRNRQIRRMFERVGNHVVLLKRIRIGHLHIGDMKPGEARILTRDEIVIY